MYATLAARGRRVLARERASAVPAWRPSGPLEPSARCAPHRRQPLRRALTLTCTLTFILTFTLTLTLTLTLTPTLTAATRGRRPRREPLRVQPLQRKRTQGTPWREATPIPKSYNIFLKKFIYSLKLLLSASVRIDLKTNRDFRNHRFCPSHLYIL